MGLPSGIDVSLTGRYKPLIYLLIPQATTAMWELQHGARIDHAVNGWLY